MTPPGHGDGVCAHEIMAEVGRAELLVAVIRGCTHTDTQTHTHKHTHTHTHTHTHSCCVHQKAACVNAGSGGQSDLQTGSVVRSVRWFNTSASTSSVAQRERGSDIGSSKGTCNLQIGTLPKVRRITGGFTRYYFTLPLVSLRSYTDSVLQLKPATPKYRYKLTCI